MTSMDIVISYLSTSFSGNPCHERQITIDQRLQSGGQDSSKPSYRRRSNNFQKPEWNAPSRISGYFPTFATFHKPYSYLFLHNLEGESPATDLTSFLAFYSIISSSRVQRVPRGERCHCGVSTNFLRNFFSVFLQGYIHDMGNVCDHECECERRPSFVVHIIREEEKHLRGRGAGGRSGVGMTDCHFEEDRFLPGAKGMGTMVWTRTYKSDRSIRVETEKWKET